MTSGASIRAAEALVERGGLGVYTAQRVTVDLEHEREVAQDRLDARSVARRVRSELCAGTARPEL